MKNNIQFKQQLFLVLTAIFFTSCLSNVDEEVIIEEPVSEITFNVHVKPIIDNNCTQCHSTAGGTSPNLETYAGVSANAARIKTEVESKRMPIGGTLTDEEIQAISIWVDAGALNN